MIVPLLFKIDPVERRDNFDALQVGTLADYPTYRVHAVVLDTDTGEVLTYDLHTLVDSSRELGAEIGTVTFSPLEASRQVLTKLRDELKGVLGDA